MNLVELSLVGNEITDLTPLEGLDSLARVNLSSNRLSSLGEYHVDCLLEAVASSPLKPSLLVSLPRRQLEWRAS